MGSLLPCPTDTGQAVIPDAQVTGIMEFGVNREQYFI